MRDKGDSLKRLVNGRAPAETERQTVLRRPRVIEEATSAGRNTATGKARSARADMRMLRPPSRVRLVLCTRLQFRIKPISCMSNERGHNKVTKPITNRVKVESLSVFTV